MWFCVIENIDVVSCWDNTEMTVFQHVIGGKWVICGKFEPKTINMFSCKTQDRQYRQRMTIGGIYT